MLKITWNTYLLRRELWVLGCKFSYEEKAWLSNHNEEIIDFCIKNNLQFDNYEKEIELWEAFEIQQKNIRAVQRAERYRERAWFLEQKAENTTIPQHERDFLSLAEPVKIWHHSEWRHRRLLERSRRKMDKQHELYEKSNEAEKKADYRANKKFYTEEEKTQKKQRAKQWREKAEQLRIENHKIGDMYDWRHCSGIIKKINAKSVILETWSKLDIWYAKDFGQYLQKAKEYV